MGARGRGKSGATGILGKVSGRRERGRSALKNEWNRELRPGGQRVRRRGSRTPTGGWGQSDSKDTRDFPK